MIKSELRFSTTQWVLRRYLFAFGTEEQNPTFDFLCFSLFSISLISSFTKPKIMASIKCPLIVFMVVAINIFILYLANGQPLYQAKRISIKIESVQAIDKFEGEDNIVFFVAFFNKQNDQIIPANIQSDLIFKKSDIAKEETSNLLKFPFNGSFQFPRTVSTTYKFNYFENRVPRSNTWDGKIIELDIFPSQVYQVNIAMDDVGMDELDLGTSRLKIQNNFGYILVDGDTTKTYGNFDNKRYEATSTPIATSYPGNFSLITFDVFIPGRSFYKIKVRVEDITHLQ